jgi:hypothetical protein
MTYISASVPLEVANYRLTMDATGGPSDVSNRISVVWAFEHGWSGEYGQPVPLVVARFLPALDETNTAPAGVSFTFPVQVESAVAGVSQLAVHASFDDGASWLPVSLTRSRDSWRASLTHPPGPAHVSLRAKVTDGRGNTGEVTIIRAYHIG